jgi:hypothetical protein
VPKTIAPSQARSGRVTTWGGALTNGAINLARSAFHFLRTRARVDRTLSQ